jgi:hypothetical protein
MTLIPHDVRQAVFDRAAGLCEYCCLPQATQVATFPVDHVTPISVGGLTELENLALACPRCNAAKWIYTTAADPISGEIVSLFNPRRDVWLEHFRWADDPTRMEAHSPIARATIALLDLNSEHRRQVRHWLAALDLHPPSDIKS